MEKERPDEMEMAEKENEKRKKEEKGAIFLIYFYNFINTTFKYNFLILKLTI